MKLFNKKKFGSFIFLLYICTVINNFNYNTMSQEEKDLLLKDLSARLPYGVKVLYENKIFDVEYFCPMYEEVKLVIPETWTIDVSEVKPYLFPMSSMSEEQKEKALSLLKNCDYYLIDGVIKWLDNCPIEFFDWCNKHHFDYRGLIPMGLANDATGLNIY